ncbi:hypothetical protein [Marinoscillum sp. MHG1-6]|uniref:hypothetical protein n=1 Tax=Marinoscillum sp. MHG1-6 TaxID=2959627 RepID=UPI002157AD9D|nr:hypothetical protein [Marinoscillum sp. MHG1-6]
MLITMIVPLQEDANYRQLFDEAYASEDRAEEIYEAMKEEKVHTALAMAYFATIEMIMADNAIAPWNKLSYFNRGSDRLNEAVEAAKENVEIRYLRFACQTKAPDFLGYDDYIEEDKAFLMQAFNEMKDADLKQRVQRIMKISKHITEEERKLFL